MVKKVSRLRPQASEGVKRLPQAGRPTKRATKKLLGKTVKKPRKTK